MSSISIDQRCKSLMMQNTRGLSTPRAHDMWVGALARQIEMATIGDLDLFLISDFGPRKNRHGLRATTYEGDYQKGR